ncbi:MAG: ABC transporter ATP-binding protein/permease [Pseudomonadota bacterium]
MPRAHSAPDPDAKPHKPALETIGRFLPYLWGRDMPDLKWRIILAVLIMLMAKGLTLIVPFFYRDAIDELSDAADPALLAGVGLIGAYGLARFAATAFNYLRDAVYVRVGQRAVRAIGLEVFKHLHRLSLRFHLERRTGGLTRAVERGTKSIDTMLYFLVFNILPTFIELGAVGIIFGVEFGWELVLMTVACVLGYVGYTAWVTEWRTKLRREMVDQDTKANSRAIDSLLNYETVKYFGNETHEITQYNNALKRYEDAASKSDASLALLNIGQGLLTSLCLAGCMALIAWRMITQGYSVGDVVLVNTMLIQMFQPLNLLGWVYREIKQGLVDMDFMFGLLDQKPEVSDKPGAPSLGVTDGSVTFDHVRFCYEKNRIILRDLSFEIPGGKTLAVVGHSGAGKSTLSRILFRFYDITSGAVTIDGQDVRDVTQESLRRNIGIVPQDTVLFNDTIAYNIGYGRPGAGMDDIKKAAEQAQIHSFVESLPDGYDSIVGERGLKLSGGEKQRVAIARTILKNPPLLILDEATSALDTRTERDIQASLNMVAQSRTTLIIAHRLSTVVDADKIIVLSHGDILEEGRHQDLLSLGGVYADMWQQQQNAAAGIETEAAE